MLRKSAQRQAFGRAIEDQVIARARAPWFFRNLGVPDTVDGRFDMVVLHAWLALVRLKGNALAAQGFTDALFVGFDEALREQGVSDMGMGKRMKAIAGAYYGRVTAYDAATNDEEMAQALARNVWRGGDVTDNARRLAAYVQSARAALAKGGEEPLDFGPLPGGKP